MDSDACVCSESEFYNPEEEALNQTSLCFSSIISFVSLVQFQKRELFKKKMKKFFTSFNQPSVCGKKKNSHWPVLLPTQISRLVDNMYVYVFCLRWLCNANILFSFYVPYIYCFPEFVSLHSAVSGIHLGWKSESWWLLYDSNYYNNNTNTNNNNDNIIVILYKSIPRIIMFCSALSSALLKTPTKLQQSFP